MFIFHLLIKKIDKSPLYFIIATCILSGVNSVLCAQNVFEYRNPINLGIDPQGIRDCQVFRDGDKWYMTGTAYPVWPREETFGRINPGVPLYSSDDLIHWNFERILVHPNPEKWYFMRFWASEIHKINYKYYLSFSCRNPNLGDNRLRIGYAVADSLLGPYKVFDHPLDEGNDLHFFQDDDGSVYAFWNKTMEAGMNAAEYRAFGISFAKIDLENGKFLSKPSIAIPYGKEGEWDGIGQEGSYVIKNRETYYLFYSSWTRGYEVGYATSQKITGPWKKFPDNPIYGGQDSATCIKRGIPYAGDRNAPFSHVGHTNVFNGPDGRFWLSCHGILASDSRGIPMLMIEPLEFDAKGNLTIGKPDTIIRKILIVE